MKLKMWQGCMHDVDMVTSIFNKIRSYLWLDLLNAADARRIKNRAGKDSHIARHAEQSTEGPKASSQRFIVMEESELRLKTRIALIAEKLRIIQRRLIVMPAGLFVTKDGLSKLVESKSIRVDCARVGRKERLISDISAPAVKQRTQKNGGQFEELPKKFYLRLRHINRPWLPGKGLLGKLQKSTLGGGFYRKGHVKFAELLK